MEELRPAMDPAASAARRGLRVQRRRRTRLRRLSAAAGVLLLLAALVIGLVAAQQGVADLAGPGAPVPPLAAACGRGGCWVALFGHRTGVASGDARAIWGWAAGTAYNVMTWLSRKSIRWR